MARGFGGNIDEIAKGMEDTLPGTTDKGGKDERFTAVDPDAGYPGNVSGCCSKPVGMPAKKGK